MRTPIVLPVLVVAAGLVVPAVAQPGASGHVKPLKELERQELGWLIGLVDRASGPEGVSNLTPAEWQVHFMQTSDGLGYVPFSVELDPALVPAKDARVYVRVASRTTSGTPGEHSTLRRWLERPAGRFIPPSKGSSAFAGAYRGEMPVGGPSLSMGRSDQSSVEATVQIRVLDKEKEKEADAAGPPADLEARSAAAMRAAGEFVFPFEDFDFAPALIPQSNGALLLQRALAVPPGDYDVYVAVAERAPSRKALGSGRATVVKYSLQVPAHAPDAPALSSLILAERVVPLDRPYSSEAQASHPYALGWSEIKPSRDDEISIDEPASVVFQVQNPRPNASRKPDLVAGYRVYRRSGAAEQLVRALESQRYDASTLPADFDLAKGHQVVAMQALPLKALGAGDYRLEVTLTDKVANRTSVASLPFTVVAPPDTLLRSAPPLVPAFTRAEVLQPEVLAPLMDALAASEGLSKEIVEAVSRARAGQYGSLMTVTAAAPADAPVVLVLRGLSLLALEQAPAAAATLFRQALDVPATRAPAAFFLAACFALQGRERDAIANWTLASGAGVADPAVAAFPVRAYLRAGDPAGALQALSMPAAEAIPALDRARLRATALIALGREAEALTALEGTGSRPDEATAFLRLRAMFSAFANAREPGTSPEGRARFAREARAYADAGGAQAVLVTEWMKAQERAASDGQRSR